jgi:hypothetical protein
MPSPANILSPITLFSYGRSGTSLLSDVFLRHPNVFVIGETGPLIFDTWSALESGLPNCRERVRDGQGMLPVRARCIEAVRSLFLAEFPSDLDRWMQKPIGLPETIKAKATWEDCDGAATWYWDTFSALFPASCTLMAFRNPFDTIASAVRYSGIETVAVAKDLLLMLKILNKCPSELPIVLLDDLIQDKSNTLARIFDYAGLAHYDGELASFQFKHAPYRGSYGKQILEDRVTAEDFKYGDARAMVSARVGERIADGLNDVAAALVSKSRLRP